MERGATEGPLRNFETALKMAKIVEEMKKSLVQLAFDPLLASISGHKNTISETRRRSVTK